MIDLRRIEKLLNCVGVYDVTIKTESVLSHELVAKLETDEIQLLFSVMLGIAPEGFRNIYIVSLVINDEYVFAEQPQSEESLYDTIICSVIYIHHKLTGEKL